MPFNFRSSEFLSHSKLRKNQVSLVRRASPAHMNNPLEIFVHIYESSHILHGIYDLVQTKNVFLYIFTRAFVFVIENYHTKLPV